MLTTLFKRPISNGIFWGIIGGALLIIASLLTTKGVLQILPIPLIVLLAIISSSRSTKLQSKLYSNFISGLIAFIISSIILYIYLTVIVNPHSEITIYGHTWRLLIIGISGIIGSGMITLIGRLIIRK